MNIVYILWKVYCRTIKYIQKVTIVQKLQQILKHNIETVKLLPSSNCTDQNSLGHGRPKHQLASKLSSRAHLKKLIGTQYFG